MQLLTICSSLKNTHLKCKGKQSGCKSSHNDLDNMNNREIVTKYEILRYLELRIIVSLLDLHKVTFALDGVTQ